MMVDTTEKLFIQQKIVYYISSNPFIFNKNKVQRKF